MSTTKRWSVEILIDEADGRVHAVARLDTSEDAHVHGRGTWRIAGDDDSSTAGEELAVAKALSEVAAKLSVRAADDADGSGLALIAHA